jgi:lysophospholipase L1-like esterase
VLVVHRFPAIRHIVRVLPPVAASCRSTRTVTAIIVRAMKHVALLLALLASTPTLAADHWMGTWATAAQPAPADGAETFRNQSVRLIVHVSAGGHRLRVRLSNLYGDRPLQIGGAHLARRATGADILAATDRALLFLGRRSVTVAAHAEVVSDAVDLPVPPLSDLAVTIYLPGEAPATTSHALALQTNYLSASGDATGLARFPTAKTLSTWPFLTGVDVAGSSKGAAIVAFGSSLTDGDRSTDDANQRYPDVLALRLQQAFGPEAPYGVLNEGIIGNRLLHDSPGAHSPFGTLLGEAGLKRFDRDVLGQAGVRYVLIALGVNDILFPAFPFTPADEQVTRDDLIAGYHQLVARAHARGVRAIGTTIPPFEGATFKGFGMNIPLYTEERERTRTAVNEWIRHGGAFDGVVDFDQAVRDPQHPIRLLPAYAAEDRLHVKDAGNVAQAKAIALELFSRGSRPACATLPTDRPRSCLHAKP